jgi:hypothetical protein
MPAISLNEAVIKMRKAGATNVRAVPMAGQNVHTGNYQIEIMEGAGWTSIVSGIPKTTADSLIAQATNRVLLG